MVNVGNAHRRPDSRPKMCRVESNHLHWLIALIEGRILEEIAVLDGLGDAGQLLIYNAACTDVGVANLRLPIWPSGRPTSDRMHRYR